MNTRQEKEDHDKDKDKDRDIEIFVNGKPVKVKKKELTGLEIKQAAIAQGVNIKLDFLLFQDLANGQQEPVKDDDVVKVRHHMRFEAVGNDDNS